MVEADIKGFFDNIDQEWMLKMLALRIQDGALLGLICKWLRAGILEEDGQVKHPETGTAKGGLVLRRLRAGVSATKGLGTYRSDGFSSKMWILPDGKSGERATKPRNGAPHSTPRCNAIRDDTATTTATQARGIKFHIRPEGVVFSRLNGFRKDRFVRCEESKATLSLCQANFTSSRVDDAFSRRNFCTYCHSFTRAILAEI